MLLDMTGSPAGPVRWWFCGVLQRLAGLGLRGLGFMGWLLALWRRCFLFKGVDCKTVGCCGLDMAVTRRHRNKRTWVSRPHDGRDPALPSPEHLLDLPVSSSDPNQLQGAGWELVVRAACPALRLTDPA